jgi:hypothetical protein
MNNRDLEPPDEQALDALLRQMPRNIAPPRDLWPAIDARLVPARLRPPAYALAAAAAVVLLSSLVTTIVIVSRHPPAAVAGVLDPGPAQTHSAGAADARLVATRAQLRQAFDERLPLLAPQTRAAVLKSLRTIEQAHQDLRRALDADPASPMLRDLLESTWQQEYALYDNVVRGTEPLIARNST